MTGITDPIQGIVKAKVVSENIAYSVTRVMC